MTVSELIDKLREQEPEAEITYLIDSPEPGLNLWLDIDGSVVDTIVIS